MSHGKTIELFLVNGTTDIITAQIDNWNGKAIKLPRTEIKTSTRDDIKLPGVYFLFCQEEDGTDSVYIGEGENVQDRLKIHIDDFQAGKEKYYWNSCVIFVGTDLNKAHIRYLENRLVEITKESNRYKVLTKNTYKNTVLKESQISSMEEFIDNIKVLISALGYKVLDVAPKAKEKDEYFYCSGGGGKGTGFLSADGFTVLKGSKISDHVAPSFEIHVPSYYKLRNQLVSDGTIVDGKFQKDYEFKAPSAASSVIMGHSTNGNIEWKTQGGVKLKDYELE